MPGVRVALSGRPSHSGSPHLVRPPPRADRGSVGALSSCAHLYDDCVERRVDPDVSSGLVWSGSVLVHTLPVHVLLFLTLSGLDQGYGLTLVAIGSALLTC